MKYRVEIEETTTKIFMVDAMNPADALAKAKNDGGTLMSMRTGAHTETYRADDRGNALDNTPVRY